MHFRSLAYNSRKTTLKTAKANLKTEVSSKNQICLTHERKRIHAIGKKFPRTAGKSEQWQ